MRKIRRRVSVFQLISLCSLAILSSCGTSHMEVQSYDAAKANEANASVYYLPQTVLDFELSVLRSYYTPGPYAAYSEKLLGITGIGTVPTQNHQIWEVKADSHQEADRRYPFLVFLKQQKVPTPLFLQLTSRGLLMPAEVSYQQQGKSYKPNALHAQYCYTDLSSQPFVDSEKDVSFSVVQVDSAFVSIPIIREVAVKRSLEEKAQQAAEQIFTLRKRRMEFLLGDDIPSTPDAIPTLLKEITRLESEYLSLFIGRTVYDTIRYQFSYTPTQSENSVVLCRFSEAKGIVAATDMTARPVILQLTCEKKQNLSLESLPVLRDAYYYRTAVPVELQLTIEGTTLYQGRRSISQYGQLMHLPVSLRITNE